MFALPKSTSTHLNCKNNLWNRFTDAYIFPMVPYVHIFFNQMDSAVLNKHQILLEKKRMYISTIQPWFN